MYTYPLGLADDLRRGGAPHQAQQDVAHQAGGEPRRETHEFSLGDHRGKAVMDDAMRFNGAGALCRQYIFLSQRCINPQFPSVSAAPPRS